jgi:hypothetical protein
MCMVAHFRLAAFAAVVLLVPDREVHAQARPPLPPPPLLRPAVQIAPAPTRALDVFATVSLADIGFTDGFRFGNLGGHREVFVPLPQGGEALADEFAMVLDDVSAYEARRNLLVTINDRTMTSISLDGHSTARVVRIPLPKTKMVRSKVGTACRVRTRATGSCFERAMIL